MRQWIAEGCRADEPGSPTCVGILLKHEGPATLRWPQPSTQIKVIARFANGTTRDVSHLAQFTSSDEAIATVQPNGTITGVRRGVAAVMVRYLEHVEARAFTFVKPVTGFQWKKTPAANFVDEHVQTKLRELQFQPAALSSDPVFVRRVYLDVLGRLPTPTEQRTFAADAKPDKRARLIDALLKRRSTRSFGRRNGEPVKVGSHEFQPPARTSFINGWSALRPITCRTINSPARC